MSYEETKSVVKAVLEEINENKRSSANPMDMLLKGLFSFIIPGIITLFASYFAVKGSLDQLKLELNMKIQNCEKEFIDHKRDNEKQFDHIYRKNTEQDKDFNEFVKEYYRSNPDQASLHDKY